MRAFATAARATTPAATSAVAGRRTRAAGAARTTGVRVQPKLSVSTPGDPYEREAEEMAERVTAIPDSAADATLSTAPQVQRACTDCEEEEQIRRDADASAGTALPQSATTAIHAVGAGQPLSASDRAYFEPRFGHAFDAVRIHTGAAPAAAARAIGARAYTYGSDIGFADGAFAPSSAAGRRLLAHELTHVVQQGGINGDFVGRGGAGLVQRDKTTGDPPVPSEETTAAPAPGMESSEQRRGRADTTLVNDRVDLVRISCDQMRVAFDMRGGTYLFHLSSCDRSFPAGRYTATVKRHGKARRLGFFLKAGEEPATESEVEQTPEPEESQVTEPAPSAAGASTRGGHDDEPKVFRFGWVKKHGQLDPVDLFKDQDTVAMEIGASIAEPTERRPECLLRLAPTTLFGPNSATVDLSKHLPFREISTERTLADFGLADIVLRIGATASASAGWEHSAGEVSDICLSSSERGGYTGRARFRIDGKVHLLLELSGYMEVAAEVLLGLLDVASVGGSLTLTGTADVSGKLDQLVEVTFNPKRPIKDLGLSTDLELSALAAFGMNLSAEAGVEILGVDIWQKEWPSIFAAGGGYAWTGGLVFENSFIPRVELGSIKKAAPMQMQSQMQALTRPGRSSPGRAARRQARRSIPIKELIEQAITGESGQTVYNGLSRDTAIPVSWFKPKSLYPEELTFDPKVNPGVDPTSVKRDDGPTWVRHDAVSPQYMGRINGPSKIGVSQRMWPDALTWSTGFQFVEATGAKSRSESNTLRELLKGLGWVPKDNGTQIDHVKELQFGGADQFNNLWPFDHSANPSAGQYHRSQIAAFRKLIAPDLNDRWMRITTISLAPKFEPHWGEKLKGAKAKAEAAKGSTGGATGSADAAPGSTGAEPEGTGDVE